MNSQARIGWVKLKVLHLQNESMSISWWILRQVREREAQRSVLGESDLGFMCSFVTRSVIGELEVRAKL